MNAYRLDFDGLATKTVTAYDLQEAIELAELHIKAIKSGGTQGELRLKGVMLMGIALDRSALRHYAKTLEKETTTAVDDLVFNDQGEPLNL